jgi:hypothetical protein
LFVEEGLFVLFAKLQNTNSGKARAAIVLHLKIGGVILAPFYKQPC